MIEVKKLFSMSLTRPLAVSRVVDFGETGSPTCLIVTD
jgi:hypothetical protein